MSIEGEKRNNLIMIAADQLRSDVLGMGVTPNLEQLRGESVSLNGPTAPALCASRPGAPFSQALIRAEMGA